MKKILIILIVLEIIMFSSCTYTPDYKGIQLYLINHNVFEVNDGKISTKEILRIDEEKQRFIWSFETNNLETQNTFSFSFDDCSMSDPLENSNEFTYITATGENVQFNTSGSYKDKYVFTGSKIIYIYYNNASNEIKDIINKQENTTTIRINNIPWFFLEEIFLQKSN